MKTNIFLVLIATAAYSYLFYMQSPGQNQAVFTYVLTALFALTNLELLKQPRWLLAAAAAVATGTITGVTGSELSILINLGTILVLTYMTANRELSIITGGIYAGVSVISGLFLALANSAIRYVTLTPQETAQTKTRLKWYYFVLPTIVLILFLVLYRQSSGAFQHLTDQIDLSFISPQWFFFTFAGFFLLFGLFNHPKELNFLHKETTKSNSSFHQHGWKTPGFLITGIILFIMLDVLLAIVNLTDIVYLSVLDPRNMDMTYAELIHQGVGSMIFSLILAVGFILLWINEENSGKPYFSLIRITALIWVGLNLIMLCTNIYKNCIYIDVYGLTYLRIGVFFFLFMALLTLVFCTIKIVRFKNNWYMYRRVGLATFSLAILFNFFNWNTIIARHNIQLYSKGKINPDLYYLYSLSSDCLPIIADNWETLNPENDPALTRDLRNRCYDFMNTFYQKNWRSLTWNNYFTFEKLAENPVVSSNEDEIVFTPAR